MKNNSILLHLTLIEHVGPTTIQKIVETNFALSDMYQLSAQQFRQLFGLREKAAQALVVGLADEVVLEKELRLIEKHSINLITIADDAYPFLLKNIHMPPPVLYYQGADFDDNEKMMAVIGARKANSYGESVIDILVPQLVENSWTIVSGGARGADSMAHAATLRAGGKTIAILGSGLLKPYPRENVDLFDRILETGGTMVSSFPLNAKAFPGNFPARNRIIAGLSRGCVVIQAAEKSGARITANFALDQGREVFAVPGIMGDELSGGCHALIKMGAKLIDSVDDILEEFGECNLNSKDVAQKPIQLNLAQALKDQYYQNKISHKTNAKNSSEKELLVSDDTPQGRIIGVCVNPCSTDDLAQKTGFEPKELHALLFDLQLQGKVSQNFMGMWERS